MKFMNLPKPFCDKQKAKVIIFPVSFKSKCFTENDSYKGCEEIIKASYELEYFDEELFLEPYEKGIFTEKVLKIKNRNFETISHKILDNLINIPKDKFLVTIGSDHSTTIPIVKAFEKKEKNFGVLVLDAHSDLREVMSEQKDNYWHASVSRVVSENHKTLVYGVRSMDYYDLKYLKKNKNISLVMAENILKKKIIIKNFLKKLPEKIYISIDVDVFDTSFIRCVDTPEPGGLGWYDVLFLLKEVFKEKKVIGVDIVEFSPKGKHDTKLEAYCLSKLIYKIIGYKFYNKKT